MEKIIAIIRVNSKKLGEEMADLQRFSRAELQGIRFRVPKVIILKRTLKKEHEFIEKPLLFNYGFLEIPLEYAKSMTALLKITQLSNVLQGFFSRAYSDLTMEKALAEADGLSKFLPVLVRAIEQEELDRLVEVAKEINVYDDVQELGIDSYIVLRGYPFDGLGAKVIRKKTNGRIQVELIESGLQVWLEKDNIYYTSYAEDD